MESVFSRTELILGEEATKKLKGCRVAVFGVGGVGGYATEAIARCGVGTIDIIDSDTVALSNINRQIIATHSTVGRPKVEVMKERILDINPDCQVNGYKTFFSSDNSHEFPFESYDYVVDAIDSLKSKIELIVKAKENGVPIISSMGAGNKLSPELFRVADISKTEVCPLARAVRAELRRRGIHTGVKVVYSPEPPVTSPQKDSSGERLPIGSVSFVPSVAGLIIGGEVVKALAKE